MTILSGGVELYARATARQHSSELDVPVNFVKLEAWGRASDSQWMWIVPECCICGRRHAHGGGGDIIATRDP
jgi:hypothetical protein